MRFAFGTLAWLLVLGTFSCTWGTYNGGDGAAGGVDSGPPMVVCGNGSTCTSPQACCIPKMGGGTGPTCIANFAQGCAGGTLLTCDSQSDCSQKQVCCVTINAAPMPDTGPSMAPKFTASCSDSCMTADVLCATNQDCVMSQCQNTGGSNGCRLGIGSCAGPRFDVCNPY